MSDTQEQNKDAAPQKTQWGVIILDMIILMAVMGAIGFLCNLLMKPFEKTYPTDSLVSIILKGGVKDNVDEVFTKELTAGVEKYPDFINIGDRTGRTPLMWAVYANFNNPEEAAKKDANRCFYVRELLKVPGINPNLADNDGFTALHWAAWSGLPGCCELLIKEGHLDVNAVDSSGYSPLMLAALRGNQDTARILLENGANPDLRNAEGKSALDLAQSFESAYSCRASWLYSLIYSDKREAAYGATLGILNGDAPAEPAAAPAAEPAAGSAADAAEAEEILQNEVEVQEGAAEPTTINPTEAVPAE